jgi:hypothetical protein
MKRYRHAARTDVYVDMCPWDAVKNLAVSGEAAGAHHQAGYAAGAGQHDVPHLSESAAVPALDVHADQVAGAVCALHARLMPPAYVRYGPGRRLQRPTIHGDLRVMPPIVEIARAGASESREERERRGSADLDPFHCAPPDFDLRVQYDNARRGAGSAARTIHLDQGQRFRATGRGMRL